MEIFEETLRDHAHVVAGPKLASFSYNNPKSVYCSEKELFIFCIKFLEASLLDFIIS